MIHCRHLKSGFVVKVLINVIEFFHTTVNCNLENVFIQVFIRC